MVRYATIGTSWITDSFIKASKLSAPGLVLSGIYSRDEKKALEFGAKYDVRKAFTNIDELAACPDIDAVYVASPNIFHYPQSKKLLQGGKHVICEKTCVITSAELEELLEIARQKNLVFMEAIKLLHMPEIDIIEKLLPKVGAVQLCHFDFSRYSSKYEAYKAGQTPNIFRPDLAAGGLMDIGVYNTYLALYLFGEPTTVSAAHTPLRTGADGAGAVLLGYPDKVVTLTYSKISEGRQLSTIQGDEGVLLLDSIEHLDAIDFVPRAGGCESLHKRNMDIHVMSGEAEAFYRWVTDPQGSAQRRRRITDTTRMLIRTLERIRDASGIRFDV